MKRILYLTNNFSFYREIGSGPAARHLFHVRLLASHGYQVDAVAPYVNNLTRQAPEAYADQKVVIERHPGFTLHRTPALTNFQGNLLSRLINSLSVAYFLGLSARRIPAPDVVFASTPTIFVALVGWWLSNIHQCPFVLEVRDLWTDSLAHTGYLGSGPLRRLSHRLEHGLYDRANRIITLTPGIQEAVGNRVHCRPDKVTLVPNGIDRDLLETVESAPSAALPGLEKGPDDFICMFAGKHARYNGLENVLAAAHLLRAEKRLRFVFIGDGYHKPVLMRLAQEGNLDNVEFLDAVPKQQIYAYLRLADLFILPYSNQELWRVALPNKLFDYLACSRPIIAVLPPGDTSRVLAESGCGVTVAPDQPFLLAQAIQTFFSDPELCRRLGSRGKDYVLSRFCRETLGRDFLAVIDGVAGKAPDSPPGDLQFPRLCPHPFS